MHLSKFSKTCFLATDIGFLVYWSLSFLMTMGYKLVPPDLMYFGYGNSTITAWNWSFFPLDILLSTLGLSGIFLAENQAVRNVLMMVSATLTFCAGFMAISFWVFIGFFDYTWWGLNLFLCSWPFFFIFEVLRREKQSPQ